MPREKLPEDGASYRCSFTFTLYEDWQCPESATEALDASDMPDIPENVSLGGRALCERHLQFFGR